LTEEKEEELEPNRTCGGDCRSELTQIPWNTSVDMLVCLHGNCTRYRQPQGSIYTDRGNMEAVVQAMYSRSAQETEVMPRSDINWRRPIGGGNGD